MSILKQSRKAKNEQKDWEEFLRDKPEEQTADDWSWSPLGDLSSLDYDDHWLIVGNPEDIAYRLIEENDELGRFYTEVLHHPIGDELKVARRIRQLNFCLETNHVRKAGLKEMAELHTTWAWQDDSLRTKPYMAEDTKVEVVDEPEAALSALEEILREVCGRYPIRQKTDGSEAAGDEQGEEVLPAFDEWSYVFKHVTKLRQGLSRFTAPCEREFDRRIRELNRITGDYRYSDETLDGILNGLRCSVRQRLAESSGADRTLIGLILRFHGCLEDAVRLRYALVHRKSWPNTGSAEVEIELAKRYLELPEHTPWLTNYLLATILDRRILGACEDLPRIRWMMFKLLEAVGIRRAVLRSVRTEIVTGCYDAEEISRRLQRKELTLALPSLVYPLLKFGANPRASNPNLKTT